MIPTFLLQKGDALFCNANTLHTGHMDHGQDCLYFCATFHPRLLYGFENSLLYTRYVRQSAQDSSFPSLRFHSNIPWQKNVIDICTRFMNSIMETCPAKELKLQILLLQIWDEIFVHRQTIPSSFHPVNKQLNESERFFPIFMLIIWKKLRWTILLLPSISVKSECSSCF